MSIPDVHIIDLLGQRKSNPVIAMYAAGIAVMFLLFSATAASGSLLEERENNTLERLLASQMTMDQLLMGKWCFLLAVGCLQLTVMFVWGQLVFGVDLIGHLDGFIAMTLVTAGAASRRVAAMRATAFMEISRTTAHRWEQGTAIQAAAVRRSKPCLRSAIRSPGLSRPM